MDTVNVIVEIPRDNKNKYEYDHENHTIKLDRHLIVSMGYPAEYGFIPDTLGGDGDPLDAGREFEGVEDFPAAAERLLQKGCAV